MVRPPPGGPMAAIRNMSWRAETGRKGATQGTGIWRMSEEPDEGSKGRGEGPGQQTGNRQGTGQVKGRKGLGTVCLELLK